MGKKRHLEDTAHAHRSKKSKPSSETDRTERDPQTTKTEAVSDRVIQLARLCCDLQSDAAFAQSVSDLAGAAPMQAALNLGHVLHSKQLIREAKPAKSKPKSQTSPANGAPAAPPPVHMTRAYLQDSKSLVDGVLPQLPPIDNAELADAVFRHRGTLHDSIVAADPGKSYERLEFLGDAYIQLLSSRLIYHHFPTLHDGRMSKLREKLVCNAALSKHALAYGFDARAHVPHSFRDGGQDRAKIWNKLLGDIFEAYVAGAILADPEAGLARVERWLAALWLPQLRREQRSEAPASVEAKVDLARKIMGKGVRIDYIETRPPEKIPGGLIFSIAVEVTGWGWTKQRLGMGRAESKSSAGMKAAAEALANPLTAQIAAVKRDFDERAKAEREAAANGVS